MLSLHLELDSDSFIRLAAIAVEERRPIPWQAEVLLLQAIGVWPRAPLSGVLGTPMTPEAPDPDDDCAPQ
jgi:hypothetical protein